MVPSRLALCLAALLVLVAAPARAVFHSAHISEVMSGAGGDPSVQFVEIRMDTVGQGNVLNTRLTAFNCNGTSSSVLLLVPNGVVNQGTNGHWIMGSTSFAAASGLTPDFTWDPGTTGNIPTPCGMVCWGAPGSLFVDVKICVGGSTPGAACTTDATCSPGTCSPWDPTDPNQYVDCVAYGGYTGPTKTSTHDGTSTSGTPTTLGPGDGTQSLGRIGNTGNNTADFALQCPDPTNNAGSGGTIGTCTTTTTVAPTTTTTTTLPPSKCTAKEFGVAGKKASAKVKCWMKAVAKGMAVDSMCLMAAETKFGTAFAKVAAGSDCLRAVGAGSVEDVVDSFIASLTNALVNGGTAASKCTAKELSAAGKRASTDVKCVAKTISKGDSSTLSTCLGNAQTKFADAYGKAMGIGSCLTTADAAAAATPVDALVTNLKGALLPP
jgi:hypothetical protein